METLNIVILGHADHGKSSLIGRLLFETGNFPEEKLNEIREVCGKQGKKFEYGFILDAFKEEREKGVTIDTSQAYFKTDKRGYNIIDAPGHKEFIVNMLTGATQADAAVLVVAADEGIKDQTVRHINMISLLGVKSVIAVINKMDAVGYDGGIYNNLKNKINDLFDDFKIKTEYIVPVSAAEGENLSVKGVKTGFYKSVCFIDALDSLNKPYLKQNKVLCFSAQDIYEVNGKRIIAGRVESGILAQNDKIYFLPEKKEAFVNSIEIYGVFKNTLTKGECAGITLKNGVNVGRGEIAVKNPDDLNTGRRVKVKMIWFLKNPPDAGKLSLNCSTQKIEVSAIKTEKIIDPLFFKEKGENKIKQYDIIFAEIELKSDLVYSGFDLIPELSRFVLNLNGDCAAGGLIIN